MPLREMISMPRLTPAQRAELRRKYGARPSPYQVAQLRKDYGFSPDEINDIFDVVSYAISPLGSSYTPDSYSSCADSTPSIDAPSCDFGGGC